jgi:hypothetical protein
MPSSTHATDQTTRNLAAQLPRNLAANIAYFLVNVAIGALPVLRFSRYHPTRNSQNNSLASFLPPGRMMITLFQNSARILAPSSNLCIVPGGEAP